MLERTWVEKRGIANRLVNWRHFDRALLDAVLAGIPETALLDLEHYVNFLENSKKPVNNNPLLLGSTTLLHNNYFVSMLVYKLLPRSNLIGYKQDSKVYLH